MATLKISDLSVGDWVEIDHEYYGWQPAQINVCGDLGIGAYFKDIDPEEEYDCTLSQARPIPITAEILETNGFMLLSDSFSTYEYATLLGKMLRSTRVYLDAPQSISVSLQDTTIERGFYHREKTSVRILRDELYVHDLQHALRLAGVDKEINL